MLFGALGLSVKGSGQRSQDYDNFCMPINCCPKNWGFSIFIWCIRIICQGAKILTIPVYSLIAAQRIWISVFLFGALGLFVKGAKILTISVFPKTAAQKIGVSPSLSGALGLSVKGAKILTISVCCQINWSFYHMCHIYDPLCLYESNYDIRWTPIHLAAINGHTEIGL